MMSIMFVLTLALASSAATDSATADSSVKPTKPVQERLVCRSQERLGTRLGAKRVCNTKARWAEIEAESGAAVRDAQRSMSSMPTNGT